MLALRLPKNLEDRLEQLAVSTHRTKSFYAREAIERYLEDLEDLYAAETAYQEYRNGTIASIPIGEVARKYDV
jgi:RHH-type rel operon transcriptional repressor/antitoxin RelB